MFKSFVDQTVTISRRKSVSFAENLVKQRCIDETYDKIETMNVTYQKSVEVEEKSEEASKRKSILKSAATSEEDTDHGKDETVIVASPEPVASIKRKSTGKRKSTAEHSHRRESRAFSIGDGRDDSIRIMSDDILSELMEQETKQTNEKTPHKPSGLKPKPIFKSRQVRKSTNELQSNEPNSAVQSSDKANKGIFSDPNHFFFMIFKFLFFSCFDVLGRVDPKSRRKRRPK